MRKFGYSVLGFLLLFNFQFPPEIRQAVRAIDYVGIGVILTLFVYVARGGPLPKGLFVRVGVVLGVAGFWVVISVVDNRSIVEPIRWILSLGYALLLLQGITDEETRPYVLKGMILGAAGNLIVLIVQVLGFFQLTVSLGIAAPDADVLNSAPVLDVWRPPGMYGTNATSAVAVICIPAAIALYQEGTSSIGSIAIAFGIVVGTSAITLTRSALLVTIAILAIWGFLKAAGVKQFVGIALTTSVFITGIALVGPPGGWERWEGASLKSKNAQLRIRTTAGSAELAIQNPAGLGRQGYQHLLEARTGYSATHNALTYLALSGGLPVATVLIFYLIGRSFSVFSQRDFVSWLAVTLLGLFMWEELLRNPTFITTSVMVILAGISNKYKSFSLRL
jgi:hypothetical protein